MSTKYDGRIDQLEAKIAAAGELPKEARGPYFKWADDDFSAIKKELVQKYGTHQGAEFFTLGWDIKSDTDKAPAESV
jgi:hypothetical protein